MCSAKYARYTVLRKVSTTKYVDERIFTTKIFLLSVAGGLSPTEGWDVELLVHLHLWQDHSNACAQMFCEPS